MKLKVRHSNPSNARPCQSSHGVDTEATPPCTITDAAKNKIASIPIILLRIPTFERPERWLSCLKWLSSNLGSRGASGIRTRETHTTPNSLAGSPFRPLRHRSKLSLTVNTWLRFIMGQYPEAPMGVEPICTVLQTATYPFGHGT